MIWWPPWWVKMWRGGMPATDRKYKKTKVSVLVVFTNFLEVLVTGASGYLGVHCVKRLLADGYTVRGTVRCLSNQCKVTPLRDLAFEYPENRLQLVEADLNVADSWQE